MSVSGPPRPPWLYRFVSDTTAQSSTVAVALVLALTVVGTTTVIAFGSSALSNTQETADLQRTEHAMTLLDSRGAMSALGDADGQRVALGRTGEGSYEVEQNSGWIRVVHKNFSGTNDEVLLDRSLGSVRYRVDGETIAYQGGGVWRTAENGTKMVSPPEFHYRDQTLTMPLVRVSGSGSASGDVDATVEPVTRAQRAFPNESASYSGISRSYGNPVKNGTVVVTVHSEHYRGWADYFESRTEGDVTVDDAARTASVELQTLTGAPGPFEMPLEGSSLEVPSVAQKHNVTKFTLTLQPDSSNNNEFQQLHWSMYYDGADGQQFELHFTSNGRCQGGSFNDEIDLSLYYRHNYSSPSEEWQHEDIDPSNPFVSVDCTGGQPSLEANLTSTLDMTYEEIDIQGSDNKWRFGPDIKDQSIQSSLPMDQHAVDTDVTDGDTRTLDFLVNHYFSRMGPDFELTVTDGPGGSQKSIEESASAGELYYDSVTGEEFIQYLHITENDVRVSLDT